MLNIIYYKPGVCVNLHLTLFSSPHCLHLLRQRRNYLLHDPVRVIFYSCDDMLITPCLACSFVNFKLFEDRYMLYMHVPAYLNLNLVNCRKNPTSFVHVKSPRNEVRWSICNVKVLHGQSGENFPFAFLWKLKIFPRGDDDHCLVFRQSNWSLFTGLAKLYVIIV